MRGRHPHETGGFPEYVRDGDIVKQDCAEAAKRNGMEIDKVFCRIGEIIRKGGKEAILEAIGGPVCLSGFKRLLD